MKKISEPIVFFGSGPVAAESLELLLANFDVEAVITKPRAPHHKGDVPVLNLATKQKLPVFTAQNKKELNEVFSSKPFKSRFAILIDFGIIVSQQVIDYFPLGIINSHFSLLPEWRGADPITFAVLSGQKTTGVSLMLLTTGMDEGPLLSQAKTTLPPNITTPDLTEILIHQSYDLLTRTIPGYLSGEIKPAPQELQTIAPNSTPTYSRPLTKNDGVIDWRKPAAQIEREVRAFMGWPQSRTTFGNLDVIITECRVMDALGEPGETTVLEKRPVVFCGQGALSLEKLKPAGKKEMTGEAFLAGYRKLFLENYAARS